MERRLKERLVGATLLVALIVLIVPELLSGPSRGVSPSHNVPAGEPVRNVTMDVVTAKALPADAPAPGVAASAASVGDDAVHDGATDGAPLEGAAATGDAGDAAVPTEPDDAPRHHGAPTITTLGAQPSTGAPVDNGSSAPKSVATPKSGSPASLSAPPAPSAGEPHRGWSVQLGSFVSKVNAEKLDHQLKTQGFPAFVSPIGKGSGLRYRVRVGPTDRPGAEKLIGRLKKVGHAGTAVPP